MRALIALAAALATAALPAASLAQDTGRPSLGAGRGDQDRAREGVKSGRQIPLAEVLRRLAQSNKGRQLNTTMGDAGGRPAYFVQWQKPDGHVVIFVVDAVTGNMMGQQ